MKFKILILTVLLVLCIVPALAQDSTNRATFNGFSFAFDSALASNVDISQYPGDPADAQIPGGPEVRHTQFELYNGLISFEENTRHHVGGIRVYNTTDIAGYDIASAQLQQLQTLLAERRDLSSFMTVSDTANELPYLPVVVGIPVIHARARFVDTSAVSGISYVTAFRLNVSPLFNQDFFYTFQGLSSDGTHYVSAVFPVNAAMFPSEYPADFDFAAFAEQFDQYLTDSTAQLNDAAPEDFTPSLTTLDAMVQTMTFTGAPPVVADPGENTDSGLEGVTWTLVSYGSPDAPTVVIVEAPITATFSENGISGSAGCNTYSGPFQFANDTLTVGPIVSTEIACAEAVNAQETAYLNALVTASTFQITDGQLQIFYDGGVLIFTSA
jgi:heat shock protein HslJ